MLLQSYTLNMIPNVLKLDVMVNISQYDADSRTIRMTLYNGDVPFTIPSGVEIFVIGTKADNTGYQYECDFTAGTNIVTFDVKPQMTVLPGVHSAEIRIQKESAILGTANFKFNVERGALQNDTVISETDLPLVERAAEAVTALEEVTQAIEDADAMLDRTDTAIENATEVLENIGPVVEEVRGYAESAETNASTASTNALKSEGYAVGEQNGEEVGSGSPYYENNAKYFAQNAYQSAYNASQSEYNAGQSESNASGSASAASGSADSAAADALIAEGYALGKQNGTDVSSGTYYHNNSKYYADQAANSATTASNKAQEASDSASTASGKASDASGYASDALGYKNDAKGYRDDAYSYMTTASNKASEASGSATAAGNSETAASNSALKSEGYALGEQNGSDVASGSPYYHANSKYYSEQASQSATNAGTSESNASSSASSASTNALKSEGFAVGQQNGTDVTSGSPYYENNAKYYADEAGNIKDEMQVLLDNVAMQDGYYEDMTVGNSLQLVSNVYETDKDPYTFRTSGGSLEIGDRESDKIVGCSYAWNQLVSAISSSTFDATNTTNMSFDDNSVTFTATQRYGNVYQKVSQRKDIIANHVYMLLASIKLTTATNLVQIALRLSDETDNPIAIYTSSTTNTQLLGGMVKYNTTKQAYIRCIDTRTSDWDAITMSDVMLIDLTQLFGSTIADYIYSLEQGNAGDGVAFFKKYFPKDYYSYNAGTLESVKTSKHEMVGFNQFGGTFVLGKRYNNNGEYVDGANQSHSYAATEYKIKCLPNTTYCFCLPNKGNESISFYVIDFDSNGNWLRNHAGIGIGSGKYKLFTTDPDVHQISFMLFKTNDILATEVSEVNINLHWDGERDGEYEAYVKHSYDLDPIELRGIPKLDASNNLYYDGDTYESDGTVTRNYYEHTFTGSETWTYVEASTYWYTVLPNSVPTLKTGDNNSSRISNGVVPIFVSGNIMRIRQSDNPNITSETNMNTLFANGTKMISELATPTTESADPFQDPQVVDNWGTEEYVVTAQNGVDIPVGHETKYPVDLKAKIEVAPDSPDSDGDYLMHRENGENSYVAFVKELPTLPSEDGNYLLKCTVSGTTKTLSWESQT